ncbi:hypothetical protein RND81_01G037200 [Saponaria officinalis]|uniref:Uncharacterized protein n=1 Tax=Saponaria officinalis TaxID=3572 RepID=A0AAW1N8K8_SAPOF
MNTNMIKRKRLDARSFREWHMSNIKKHKGFSPSAPEQGNMMSKGRNDKHEASCSMTGNSNPDNFCSQKPRENSDSKSQPENGEATLDRDGYIVPSVPPDNPEKMLSSGESGSYNRRKEEIKGESKFQGRPEELKSSPRFIEYWVPVGFSYLQLEKYCEILIKNWMLLCAKTKKGVMDLHDILVKGRECCDHPYLVDSSLELFVTGERPAVDILTTGIEASGKLLLLDKFLHEVKAKGLRVVIVFQSNPSKSEVVQLRHLLDDTIRRRFGEESYVHMYREFDRLKKRAVCDIFNDKKTGRFVMLMEKCSSHSYIKLSSVDFVILFNSDWCPINDLKFLQKMSIQSTGDHLNVLRLYSSNTLEEKVLTLAKEGSPLESSMTNFSYNISHTLLLWGSSFLFNKLDDFHGHCTSIANLNHLTEDKLLLDVFDELLKLSACQYGKEHNFSLISKVPEGNGGYPASISMHGEQDAPAMDGDIPPCAIWSSLLEERYPQWILLPKSSKKIRRRGEFSVRNELTPSKKTPPSQDELSCQKSKSKKLCRLTPERNSGNLAGYPTSACVAKEKSPSRDVNDVTRHVEETCMRRMRELLLKQKNEIREFYRTKREERAKLEEDHRLELDLINQGCREAVDKQKEVKRLDHLYGKKIKEHNRQMDMKRKELEDVQRASRIKEEQVKDKLIAFSQTKHFKGRISSLVNDESLLDLDFGLADSSENAIDAPNTVSEPDMFPKNKHCEENEQHHEPATPVYLHDDTEILSLESDGENDAESVPREVVSNTIENNVSPHLPLNTSSLSENLVEQTSQNMQPEPNSEIEGNSSTNIEHRTETAQGFTVENQSYREIDGDSNILPDCPVSGPLESDGENEVMIATEEAVDRGTNLCSSNGPQLCASSGQLHLEPASNLTNGVILERDCSMDASGGASNGEICGRGDEELANSATVNELQGAHEQILTELPSSRATSMSPILQQSQIVTTMDGSLPLEQPDISACPLGYEAMRIPEAPTVHNSQISHEMLGSCQLDQTRFPLSSGYNPPLLHSPVQSFAGRDQTHISSAAYTTTTMQPPNSYFPDFSSLRSNMAPSTAIDPLEIELKRMQKEEEDARKNHEEKITHIKSACEKEIEEIRKKYDLLRQEAEVEYRQKNRALGSVRTKVQSNKLLAETLKHHFLKEQSSIASDEALINAIYELPLLQQYNTSTQYTAATSARPTAAQVQVVHQLSDLMSVEPARLDNPSPAPSYQMQNPLANLLTRAPPPHLYAYRPLSPPPHLHAYRPLAPPIPMSGITSLTGRPNQATHLMMRGNSWTRPYLSNVVLAHPDGSPTNPVVL